MSTQPSPIVPTVPAPAKVNVTDPNKKRIGNLSDDDIINQVRRLRQESIDRNSSIMGVALQCWEQYRNEQNFDDKASWESRVTLAKGHAAVKHFTANMLRLLTQAEQWVTVEDVEALDGQPSFAPTVETGVLKVAELANFKDALRDAWEYGAATMFGCLKVIWQFTPTQHTTIEQGEQGLQLRQQERAVGRVGIYSIDPWKVHFGPRTRGGRDIDWIIEDSDADIATLFDLGGFENLENFIDQDRKTGKDDPNEAYRKGQRVGKDETRFRRRIELWDCWVDLIDEQTQRTVAKDVHIIVGNGERIIKFEPNKLWDKKPPYILFSPLIVAGRFPGGGLLEMNLEVKRAIDRIAQMWEEHLHFSVLPMWEAELAALENPEDVATGVFPGKIFRKKMGQSANQVFRPLIVPPLQADAFNTVIAFDKEYQRGTFITEQTQGLIDARGETTATEVQQTALASTLILSDIAMHLESQCLSPLGEMIWDRMFQFMDSTSLPNWTQIVGGPVGQFLDMLPIEVKLETVRGIYVFKAHGLSRAIERAASRNQLIQWVTTVSQLGPAQAIINYPNLFKRVHESFHLPQPDELLVPNYEAVLQQVQAALLIQANPAAVAEMKNAAAAQKTQEQNQALLDAEDIKARAGILEAVGKEAAKAQFAPKDKGKEKK